MQSQQKTKTKLRKEQRERARKIKRERLWPGELFINFVAIKTIKTAILPGWGIVIEISSRTQSGQWSSERPFLRQKLNPAEPHKLC